MSDSNVYAWDTSILLVWLILLLYFLLLYMAVKTACQVFQDEEYKRVVIPDEESFLKRSEAVMMIGYDEDKWVDGKVYEVEKSKG